MPKLILIMRNGDEVEPAESFARRHYEDRCFFTSELVEGFEIRRKFGSIYDARPTRAQEEALRRLPASSRGIHVYLEMETVVNDDRPVAFVAPIPIMSPPPITAIDLARALFRTDPDVIAFANKVYEQRFVQARKEGESAEAFAKRAEAQVAQNMADFDRVLDRMWNRNEGGWMNRAVLRANAMIRASESLEKAVSWEKAPTKQSEKTSARGDVRPPRRDADYRRESLLDYYLVAESFRKRFEKQYVEDSDVVAGMDLAKPGSERTSFFVRKLAFREKP